MRRRHFLTALSAAPFLRAASNKIDRSRLSAISDEIATSPADAIAFARKYNLGKLELRGVPGGKVHYARLPEPELHAAAKEFHDNGIKISFFNTGFLKFSLPGTDPVRKTPETPENREKRIARDQMQYDKRIEELKQGIRAAHILGVDKMRVFTFSRIAEPETVFPRVADILGEMALIAEKEHIKLLVENEGSCNVGTSAELTAMMKLLPQKNVGLNWDPQNALPLKEIPWPEGYTALLPKSRIWNVQIKGKGLLDAQQKLDWATMLHALEKDGYRGDVGLETHYFDGTNLEKAQLSMQEMIRIVEVGS